jgi:hypothetical protein
MRVRRLRFHVAAAGAAVGLSSICLYPVSALASTASGRTAKSVPGGSEKGAPSTRSEHAVGATQAVLALMKKQVAVDKAADRIAAIPGGDVSSGLGGIVVDPAHSAVKVFWHGQQPLPLRRQIAAERATGISVTVAAARYTNKQLTEQAERLMALRGDDKQLSAVGPAPDGSGLNIGVRDVSLTSARTRAQSLAHGIGIGVQLHVRARITPVADTRQADTPPYWGGAQLITPTGGGCTSGFGVRGWNGAATYILTARHCGVGTFDTGDGRTVGRSIVTRWGHDAQLILTWAGSVVYDGDSIDGSNQFSKRVQGASKNHVGDYVCESGAYSGAICDIKVTDIGQTITLEGHKISDVVQAEQQGHQAAAGSGDSGGPVFSLTDDFSADIGRGTHSSHDESTNVPCKGVPTSNDRTCGWRVYFPDIMAEMNDLGVNINTS